MGWVERKTESGEASLRQSGSACGAACYLFEAKLRRAAGGSFRDALSKAGMRLIGEVKLAALRWDDALFDALVDRVLGAEVTPVRDQTFVTTSKQR